MEFLIANSQDLEEIIQLLKIYNLPTKDLPANNILFLIIRKKNQIVGCVGLEIHTPHALLRSFAVHPEFRNQGIGKELLNHLFVLAKSKNIRTLHLLTTTADRYFSRCGFIQANRKEAPEEIKTSEEFTGLCPSSALYMVFEDIERYGK